MCRHTLIGERILESTPGLAGVAALVRASHERPDGRGYPDRPGRRRDPVRRAHRRRLRRLRRDGLRPPVPARHAAGRRAAGAARRARARSSTPPSWTRSSPCTARGRCRPRPERPRDPLFGVCVPAAAAADPRGDLRWPAATASPSSSAPSDPPRRGGARAARPRAARARRARAGAVARRARAEPGRCSLAAELHLDGAARRRAARPRVALSLIGCLGWTAWRLRARDEVIGGDPARARRARRGLPAARAATLEIVHANPAAADRLQPPARRS